MKLLRFIARVALVLPWILFGLLCVSLVYRVLDGNRRAALNRFWSRVLMRMCGVRMHISGEPRLQGAVLWVANHVSWIDIFVVNAVRATSFVAKAEIRAWPVIGWLAAGAGTLFIERTQRHAVHAMGESIQACFARGEAVGLFPEGTTTEGLDLRPFHASLFEPARVADVAVQPVVLRFKHHGERSGFAAFVGEETLVANLWRVLGATGISVEVVFLPALDTHHADGKPFTRLEVSRAARAAILERL
ncbi:1-acyl-sn-glycerol-3-phosphate acyltransferase [Bordetella genomosp. 1]|uniref:1-acyl-sn-glycerol-3-phosphate acyltransferase n=1 Tax=Bordetella genomosp. 1 TaxID=1395607 RepID=A0A261SWR8_9BORD|nr:lysophospholipid acyltransferase family protein [Bordetella genomosp. 1]OZI40743.1 1-acyl-sn-glycerol-3-phosphate acyltransferase [Bordetella genomosp. 1]OZI68940.1 1-acyl-sn-glycerol-3-phosphate acyltransferase [Bordetella genomosp. 1]